MRIRAKSVVLSIAISIFSPAMGTDIGVTYVDKTAQQYIANFQRGIDFNPNDSVAALIINRKIARSALSPLTKELEKGNSNVRENIVKLLEKIGIELDSPAPSKFAVIRDPLIIKALIVQGFAKDDSAAHTAAGILLRKCKPSDLALFNEIFVKSLQQLNGDYLYLAAKAKTLQSLPYVDKFATLPKWQENEHDLKIVKIAQAALGNTAVEDEFVNATKVAEKNAPPAPKNRFYDVGRAKDGGGVAAQIELLGFIGTNRSLLVTCSYLRSPLKTYVPDLSERSIRHDALDAIRYNFPDERVLYRPTKLFEWAAAEQFCTRNLGAVFSGPTPDLPPDQVYPTRMFSQPTGIQKPIW